MGTKLSPIGSSQSGGGSIGPTTPTDFTEGSVIFAGANGLLAQDNANFFWDNTANQLVIPGGTASGATAGLRFAKGGGTTNDCFIASPAVGRFDFGGNGYTNFLFVQAGVAMGLASNTPLVWSSSISASDSADIGLERKAAGILKVNNGSSGGGALEFLEQTAPSAATANSVRIYAQDNGAGKTQLMAKFATGAAQQIAIEP